RQGHTCTCTRNGTVVCHAGTPSTTWGDFTSNTYIFDPAINHFYEVEVPPEMEGRMFHAVAYVEPPDAASDLLFMYGGLFEGPSVNDFWMMDVGKDTNYG